MVFLLNSLKRRWTFFGSRPVFRWIVAIVDELHPLSSSLAAWRAGKLADRPLHLVQRIVRLGPERCDGVRVSDVLPLEPVKPTGYDVDLPCQQCDLLRRVHALHARHCCARPMLTPLILGLSQDCLDFKTKRSATTLNP